LFPEVFVEGRIDFGKLKATLGGGIESPSRRDRQKTHLRPETVLFWPGRNTYLVGRPVVAPEEDQAVTCSRPATEEFLKHLQPLQGALQGYCRRLLRDRSLVEDVLQAAVAAAFAQFQGGTAVKDFKAWIFRFVTLEAFNRNRKHEPITFGEAPADLAAEESWGLVIQEAAFESMLEDPDAVLEHLDDVLVEALGQLASSERAVLLLRAIGGFSYKEIHELLSIPLGSVIGYLSRARQRLRIALAGYAVERGWLPENRPGGPVL
jgi:RNA polymerase sigma-70 factor (ECF subfamily)